MNTDTITTKKNQTRNPKVYAPQMMTTWIMNWSLNVAGFVVLLKQIFLLYQWMKYDNFIYGIVMHLIHIHSNDYTEHRSIDQ